MEVTEVGRSARRRGRGGVVLGLTLALTALLAGSVLLGWPASTEAYVGIVFEDGCGGATIEAVPVGAPDGAEVVQGLAMPEGAPEVEVDWPSRVPLERRSSWWGGGSTWTAVVGGERLEVEPVAFTRVRCDLLLG